MHGVSGFGRMGMDARLSLTCLIVPLFHERLTIPFVLGCPSLSPQLTFLFQLCMQANGCWMVEAVRTCTT